MGARAAAARTRGSGDIASSFCRCGVCASSPSRAALGRWPRRVVGHYEQGRVGWMDGCVREGAAASPSVGVRPEVRLMSGSGMPLLHCLPTHGGPPSIKSPPIPGVQGREPRDGRGLLGSGSAFPCRGRRISDSGAGRLEPDIAAGFSYQIDARLIQDSGSCFV